MSATGQGIGHHWALYPVPVRRLGNLRHPVCIILFLLSEQSTEKVDSILYADAVLLRKYAGNDTLVAGILSSRNFSGVSTHSVWIQRKERQQETVSQVVFLCVLSAAPVNFRCIAVGGVCINGTRYRK